MRRLKLQMQLSVDGFAGTPEGGMDWMTWNWDEELKKYVGALTDPIDTVLLGRKMAEGFIPYWKEAAANASFPEPAVARKFADVPKVVFSRTLSRSPWEGTELFPDASVEAINALKQREGGDLMVYGGAGFVGHLLELGVIDDYYFFINPTALGRGLPIFNQLSQRRSFTLREARGFSCGIVCLHYGG